MRFETHCHTKYSNSSIPWDGLEEPSHVVRQAKKAGLAGIAITDHDATEGWKEARKEAKKQGLIFIPGIEVSTKYGHVLGLGVTCGIPKGLGVAETRERINENGGIAIAVHPFDIKGRGVKERFVETDAVETFNSLNLDRFSNYLAKSRASGTGMPVLSGTDAHTLSMIGRAAVSADAHDLDSLLKAISKGRTTSNECYISLNEMKEWNRLRIINAYMDVVRFIDNRYMRPSAWLLKHMMNRFVFSRSRLWDMLARAGLVGAMGYGAVKMIARY